MAVSSEWIREVAEGVNETHLRNQLAQIGARITLRALGQRDAQPQWTYRPERVLRSVTAASLAVQDAAATDLVLLSELGEEVRYLAQAWERLAQLDERVSRTSALLNAAVNYDLAGYQANSICLARQVQSLLDADPTQMAEATLATFLQRLYLQSSEMARRIQEEPAEATLDSLTDEELVGKGADALLALALESAGRFFLSGEAIALDQASEHLNLAARSYGSIGRAPASNLAMAVARLLPVMSQRSTWTLLANAAPGNPRWTRYLRVLGRGIGQDLLASPSISELWPSQIRAIEGGLLDAGRSIALRLPTSAGKTRVAELALVHTLATQPGSRGIYIAPYRALATEVEGNLFNLFSDLGYAATSVPGSYEQDSLGELITLEDELLVLTPEKLDLLLRVQPASLSQVAIVVIDEGHVIGDPSRGTKFELLLTRLRRLVPSARFLFMSAVLPEVNLTQFARWLSHGLHSSVSFDWRPSIQRYAKLEWSGGRGTLRFSRADVEEGGLEFVPNVITRREFSFVHPETRRRRTPKFPDSKGQVAAELAFLNAPEGPVLVFCATTPWAESVAKELNNRIDLAEAVNGHIPTSFYRRRRRASAVATEWLGEDHLVVQMLERGIAFHHGRLPEQVREAIEEDVRNREIGVLIATNTLGQGVNLPLRTVIVHSARRYNEALGRSERLPARDYWNIAGRAGRAGRETEATVIHIAQSSEDDQDFRYYEASRHDVEPVESALLRLLRDLVAQRISSDEAAARLDGDLLALLVEEDEAILDETQLRETLGESLFSIQAADESLSTEPVVRVIHTSAQDIAFRVPNRDLRRVYASTGLSSQSCEELRAHIEANSTTLSAFLSMGSEGNRSDIVQLLLDGTIGLREMTTTAPDVGGAERVLSLWLDGIPVSQMSPELGVDAISIARYVEDMFAYRLSWGVAGYIRIATHLLEISQVTSFVANLPAIIKYGVPTPEAAWAMTAGVGARRAAIDIARRYVAAAQESSPSDFKRWLSRLDIDSLGEDLQLSGVALEETARAVFRSSRNDYLAGLDEGRPLFPMDVSVRPSTRALEAGLIYRIEADQELDITRDFDSLINRNAVFLQAEEQRVGYLPWPAAQALAPELDAGVKLVATALGLETDLVVPRLLVRIDIDAR